MPAVTPMFKKMNVMRKVLSLLLLVPVLGFSQGIYTVSNAPGSTANFKTLQGAHDTVAAGSILYLLPSSFTYGDVVFTKKLTVYGTGFFLGQNLDPNTQVHTAPVYVNSIRFRPGSDNSFVEGLQLAYNIADNASVQRIVLDTVSNITISRCLISKNHSGAYGGNNNFFVLSGANNCTIRQCYLKDDYGYNVANFITIGTSTPSFSGIQFNNNIFDWSALGANSYSIGNSGTGGFDISGGGTANVNFVNNIFIGQLSNSRFGNLNYTNCFFVHTQTGYVPDPAQTYLNGTNLNNITNATSLFQVQGSNYLNANLKNIFVSGLPGYHSTDQQWMLQDTSFANTYGQGGVAVGAFGGSAPYKLSGIPGIPYIYGLTVPPSATAPGTITVHIKAKASN